MEEIISKTKKGRAHKKKANKKKNAVLSGSEDKEIGRRNIVESKIEPNQDLDTSTIKEDDYVLVQFLTKKRLYITLLMLNR